MPAVFGQNVFRGLDVELIFAFACDAGIIPGGQLAPESDDIMPETLSFAWFTISPACEVRLLACSFTYPPACEA